MNETISCPIFMENGSDGEKDLAELGEILNTVSATDRSKIEKQLSNVRKGIQGEKNVIFELKNTDIPMICVHNLYFQLGDLSAQIDFLFVMPDKVYVVESKNLYGNIEINENGEFFRVSKGNSTRMYSPLTQCEHHLMMIHRLRQSVSKEEFPRLFTEKKFENNLHPLIIIANPTCTLSADKAPVEIKNKIVHTDQLAGYLAKNTAQDEYISPRAMENFARFFCHFHGENPREYMNLYRGMKKTAPEAMLLGTKEENDPVCPFCGESLVIRQSKNGKYAGVNFYGCSTFPKCKYADFSIKTRELLNKEP